MLSFFYYPASLCGSFFEIMVIVIYGETNEDDIYVFISSGFSNSKVVYNGYRAIWDDMYVVFFSK